jgi:hypothetical protein
MYSSALTENSQIYNRQDLPCQVPEYYYEAIQVNVVESADYDLCSDSTMDTQGYLYNNTFNPFNPYINLLVSNDDGNDSTQFTLTTYLRANTTYVLVVTTFRENTVGPFSIFVSGPNNVSLNPIREYMY